MKKGISLIALIITIIVIIILAAIIINGVSGILEKSRYAKFCADLDAVQEAVSQAYATAILEDLKNPGVKKTSNQIYEWIAGENNFDTSSQNTRKLVELENNERLGLALPKYGNSIWHLDTLTGEVYLLSGFEYQGKIYRCKADIQGGGDYTDFHQCITVDIPEGSIPVLYNGENWIIADPTGRWYDYREIFREWANVITVKESVRNSYSNKPAGTVITDKDFENDVIGMFVYVPRYAYQITSHLHDGGNNIAGNIEIAFINKENKDNKGKLYNEKYPETTIQDGAVGADAKMKDFVVHPAFTDNAENGGWEYELDGIWVAKFEASSSSTELVEDKSTNTVTVVGKGKISTNTSSGRKNTPDEYITIRPNVASWRSIDVINIVAKSNELVGKHGLSDAVNCHQMKNSEWGAVAYLTHSKYGNINIYNNSYCEGDGYWSSTTGMTGDVRNDATDEGKRKVEKIYNSDGSIQMNYKDNDSKIFYPYDHVKGYHGSSTDNIYGIYDLAGGAWEYVAGYIKSDTNTSIYTGAYNNAYERNEYKVGNPEGNTNNYLANSDKYGDAVFETSKNGGGWTSWDYDASNFHSIFFQRSGAFDHDDLTGIFTFGDAGGINGGASGYYSFRVILVTR